MKLIVDIPDEAYNRLLTEQHLPNRLDIEYFIVHGIPLDNLRAEIEALLINNPWYASAITDVMQIIDKYQAERSKE